MFNFLNKLLDSNEKALKKYRGVILVVNELESKYEKLSNEALKEVTPTLRGRLEAGETIDQILPDAFAAVREAAKRTLGLRHFDVQFMASLAFHEGKVAEQKTGEGKTLSATPALYLNALSGKGAHLVTVNDYLAQRDAGWMGPVFTSLGLSVGVIYSGKGDLPAAIIDHEYRGLERGDNRLEHLRPVPRKDAYLADITYGTNNEFGFDYLRDNMAQRLDDMVQRGHHFAIVDEVDSILIDEARTPLIISAPDTEPTKKYYEFAKLIDSLVRDTDYALDEKLRTATLTDYGLRRLEKRLNVDNLYEKDYGTIHHVEQALKAKTLFTRDKDYVVKDGQVIIVDEHTGRLMFGRRYSEGLHQAIEAKEEVDIQKESRTLATISLQNYFRMYGKLAGMTGTATTEAEEFRTIYSMDVVAIPTNRDIVRKDHADMVYKTTRAKMGAIVKEVRERFEAGQPVLLGTRSIEQNDIMGRYLKRMKIPHNVLNAKNHESEAKILADAGKPGAITVATNIAGRGVDIVLGGAKPEKPEGDQVSKDELKLYENHLKEWEKQHEKVLQAGGLHILGTERHDSRRIDNQLRGRSGRQGDPGSSRFYVSLEDDIMRIFGGEQVAKIMNFLKIPEDQPIESGMVSKSIEQAQSKVESFHFDQRKRVVEYDDVMNKQREIIYKRRRAILDHFKDDDATTKLKDKFLDLIDAEIQNLVVERASDSYTNDEYQAMLQEFLSIIPFDHDSQNQILDKIKLIATPEKIVEELQTIAHTTYDQREEGIGINTMRQLERYVMLGSIDRLWMDHLDAMDDLREGIWLRGGKDQVISEYKKEAFEMFSKLLDRMNAEAVHTIFRIGIAQAPQTTVPRDQMITGKAEEENTPKAIASKPAKPSQSTGAFAAALGKTTHKAGTDDGRTPIMIKPESGQPKIGRNDPCPCGSGKKWKKCGLIGAPEHKG